jgi:hypothetical protein
MSAQTFSRAGDDEVINAFKRLPDATEWHHPNSWMTGGNIQLSREFATFAKEDPRRARQVISRLEPAFGARAAGYALEAMAESAEPTLIIGLFLELAERAFDGEEFRGSAARAIERLVNRNVAIDDRVVAVLEGWLQAPPPADSGEGTVVKSKDDGLTPPAEKEHEANKDARSVLWDNRGISILPHGNYPVLEALTRVLLARPDHDRLLDLLDRHLANPENPNVWRSLLYLLVYLRPSCAEALAAFLGRLFQNYPDLAHTWEATHLLAYAQWTIPDFVRDALATLAQSADPRVRQAYGELIALVAILQPELDWAPQSLKAIIDDPSRSDERLGAAFSAVNLWNQDGKRAAASQLLIALIPEADQRIWSAVFDLFRLIDELMPERDTIAFLTSVAEHIGGAPRLNPTFVVERLETLLPHEAPLVAKIAQGIVDGWREELGDIRTGTATIAPQLMNLAITLHRLGPATRDVGTSLFEDLLRIDAHLARQTLYEIDNRFQEVRRPIRPRLQRRSSRRQQRGGR